LLLLNATSLHVTNAVQHLAAELKHINSDFGFIVETWFKCDDDALVSIDDYVLFRHDRFCGIRRHGGAVRIYAKTGTVCSVLTPVPSADNIIEILWLHSYFGRNEFIFVLCYHPPDPGYVTSAFVEFISSSIDVLSSLYPAAVICILRHFNHLDTTFLLCEFGLIQIVDTQTYSNNLIDKVFLNVPDVYTSIVFKSLVKTKHQTVLVVPCDYK